jgi:hypothetical protein
MRKKGEKTLKSASARITDTKKYQRIRKEQK